MNKIITSGLVAAALLLALAFASLKLLPLVMPALAEEYYKPVFVNDETRNLFYFLHPVVLAFALAWFWNRFKGVLNGNWLMQGLEMGFIYLIVAIVPAMLIIYSAIDVSVGTIVTWLLYGFVQGTLAGIVFARMHA
ncbi:MAG: hypothetical protein K2X48_18515 [Chitinophagaceae bacterium]|nr:hypothetical protein [Chitinophagaceae bacterium]